MITAFLPCRKGSQRIPDKNIKPFAGIDGGLLKIKLQQLIACKRIDNIVVSSNDDRVLSFTESLNHSKITIDERADHLGSNSTTTDELIRYVPTLIDQGHILWTHVTSPFMNENDYTKLIEQYDESLKQGYDSLMTVLKVQGFIWSQSGPISYNRDELKWPMTQNIDPLYEIDSGAFISSVENYLTFNDRIGDSPKLIEQEKVKSVDIDWPDDFDFAEALWQRKL
ncbi:cytidylyltransferase domain-containing protein [Leucothrix arctica]|nr:acylneuraminate cytidylyltransferase family protein [Leucothrix arctica]